MEKTIFMDNIILISSDPFKEVVQPVVVKFVTRVRNILVYKLHRKDINITFNYYNKWTIVGHFSKDGIRPKDVRIAGSLNLKMGEQEKKIPLNGKFIFSGPQPFITWDKDVSIDTLIALLHE